MELFNYVKRYYNKIPSWLIDVAAFMYYIVPSEVRYGKTFSNTLKEIKRVETLSLDEVKDYQNTKFLEILKQAYYHVPIYRELYDENGIDITSIHGIEDIEKLPIIDKDMIRRYTDRFIADNVDRSKLIYITTSGTTGNPVGFFQPPEITMQEWAYTVNIWSRVGYRLDSSRLVLRGKKIHPAGRDGIFYDPLRKELSCDIFDMKPETMEKYCKAIEKYKPDFIHGYMSAIMVLAKYIEDRKGGLNHQFQGILATSENIIEAQKKYVESIFNTRVFSFYGHTERLVIAGECEYSTSYHVEPTYGICELINSEGKNASSGEIIATGFLNYAMPLIRYRTGDIAKKDTNVCKCNRSNFLIKCVEGRWHQDMLVNNEGVEISLTALNIHSNEFERIIRYRLIQYEKGKVKMLIQPKDSFSKKDEERIKLLLEGKTNGKISFQIELVENIPIQENGKYRIIEQHI